MKKTPMNTYEIARRFINDSSAVLGPEITKLLLGRVRSRDYASLARTYDDLGRHSSTANFARALRQVAAFFKKNSEFVDDDFCTDAALTAFERGERLCRITNRRLDYYFSKPGRLDPDLRSWIARAEAWISHVLGSSDAFIDSLPSLIRITSGATALSPRSQSLPYLKLRRRVDCTPGCRPYIEAAYRYYNYAPPRFSQILWNRVELVPKSWKTHRTIACEPSGNVPFQLAFDTYVKKELRKKTRINLSSQERNQDHAYAGSIDGSLATIDLSMASDTVSLGTVGWLLPTDWYSILRDFRSPCYRLNGQLRKYHKFSSMGNGSTFALETLIFASFLHAVGSKRGLAYGDDLTIETELVPKLLKLLKFFGFVPNVEKSYFEGPFRESCGKDYHQGVDITPFYLRSTAAWDQPNNCHNVNGLAKVSPHGELWSYLLEFVKQAKLPLTAVSYDTTVGVHLHPYHAYRQRVIRNGHPEKGDKWVLYTRGLSRKGETRTCFDSRTLFLWFLRKQASEDSVGQSENSLLPDSQATRYTASRHKFVRKWIVWRLPALDMGQSEDLFSFSESLTRISP